MNELERIVEKYRLPDLSVRELRKRIITEGVEGEIIKTYEHALEEAKDIFGLRFPRRDDQFVNLGKRIRGLPLQDLCPNSSFKYAMVAGLYLLGLLTGRKGDVIVDCGLRSSATATNDFISNFDLQGEYHIPQEIVRSCQHLGSDRFRIHTQKSRANHEQKNSCYITMMEQMTDEHFYLGHSELGWAAMLPMAKAYKEQFKDEGVDYFVSCIGAGTTMVPFVLANFAKSYSLVEEAEFHPMTTLHYLDAIEINQPRVTAEIEGYSQEQHLQAARNLARKFEENPFIPKEFWERIEGSYLVNSKASYKILCEFEMYRPEQKIGMTTAFVIAAAQQLVRQGKRVVVPIFENQLIDYS